MSDMNVWPHYCEHDHEPIGHAGDDERCPLCRMRDSLQARVNELERMLTHTGLVETLDECEALRADGEMMRKLLRRVLSCGLCEEPHGSGFTSSKQERKAGELASDISTALAAREAG